MPGVEIPGRPNSSDDVARGMVKLWRRGNASSLGPGRDGHEYEASAQSDNSCGHASESECSLPVSEVQPKVVVGVQREIEVRRLHAKYLKVLC